MTSRSEIEIPPQFVAAAVPVRRHYETAGPAAVDLDLDPRPVACVAAGRFAPYYDSFALGLESVFSAETALDGTPPDRSQASEALFILHGTRFLGTYGDIVAFGRTAVAEDEAETAEEATEAEE